MLQLSTILEFQSVFQKCMFKMLTKYIFKTITLKKKTGVAQLLLFYFNVQSKEQQSRN